MSLVCPLFGGHENPAPHMLGGLYQNGGPIGRRRAVPRASGLGLGRQKTLRRLLHSTLYSPLCGCWPLRLPLPIDSVRSISPNTLAAKSSTSSSRRRWAAATLSRGLTGSSVGNRSLMTLAAVMMDPSVSTRGGSRLPSPASSPPPRAATLLISCPYTMGVSAMPRSVNWLSLTSHSLTRTVSSI